MCSVISDKTPFMLSIKKIQYKGQIFKTNPNIYNSKEDRLNRNMNNFLMPYLYQYFLCYQPHVLLASNQECEISKMLCLPRYK